MYMSIYICFSKVLSVLWEYRCGYVGIIGNRVFFWFQVGKNVKKIGKKGK